MNRRSFRPAPTIPHSELLLMLRQLLCLFSIGAGWTKDAMARDRQDREVHPLDIRAIKWCLMGGCARVAWRHDNEEHREERYDSLTQLLVDIEPSLYTRTFARFSDEEGKDRVIEILKRGVLLQEARLHRIE